MKDLAGTQKYQMEDQIRRSVSTLLEWEKQFVNYPEISSLVENMKSDHKQLRKYMENLEEKLKRESISYYKKRIEAGGFWEEVWYSYYNMGKLHMDLGEVEK